MRSPTPALAVALAILAAACERCGGPSGPPPEHFLPADSPLLVVAPRLGAAAGDAAALLRTALQIPAAGGLGESYAALKTQLGLDPLDDKGLAEAGLDPSRGAGAAALPGGGTLLVLPVADPARLDPLLARLARDRLGAGVREEKPAGAALVVSFRRAGGSAPALSYSIAAGSALLAPGKDGPAAVAAAAARPAAASLGASPAFGAARSALGGGLSLIAFAPAGSALLSDVPPARDGAALGVSASASRVSLRAVLLLPPERHEVWNEVAGGKGAAEAGREELRRLPADLLAAGRFGGDPASLCRRVSYSLTGAAASFFRRVRVDLVRDFCAHLAPGTAAGLALAPTFDVGAVSRGVEVAARNPFRLVHVYGLARVRDPPRLRAQLERLARAAPAAGLQVRARALPGGADAWTAKVGGGVLAWALDGDRLAFVGGGGPDRLEALLAPGGERWKAPTEAAGKAVEGGAAAAAVDFGNLVRSVRALPPEAFGTGPDGFVMRSLADRFLEPASHLRAASLRLEVLPGAARLDLEAEAVEP